MIITQKINMNLEEHGIPPRIDAMQGDAYTRKIELSLFSGTAAWEIPADAKALVRFQKPDGHCGIYDTLPDGSAAVSISGNTLSVMLLPQMMTAAGLVRMHVCLTRGITEISTFEILIQVCPNGAVETEEPEDYYNVGGFLPMPVGASVGTYIRVAAVDEKGIVSAVETAGINDANVDVPIRQNYDVTAVESSVQRYSFYVGSGPIKLEKYNRCSIRKIGVMATPGCPVRFGLFAVQRDGDHTGTLTQLAVLGDAVADSQTGLASLTFEDGYVVEHSETVIMAMAAEKVIPCCRPADSLIILDFPVFADGNYAASGVGTQIPCSFTTSETANSSYVWLSRSFCDIDFLHEQTVKQYISDTAERITGIDRKIGSVLPTATVLDNGKVLTVVNGVYELAMPAAGDGLPVVTTADNGKFLRVTDGIWAAVSIESAEEASF